MGIKIEERLENLEKCCEEYKKNYEEYKKNIFYLMTTINKNKIFTDKNPETETFYFNYICENIDLFMDDNYLSTFQNQEDVNNIIYNMLHRIMNSHIQSGEAYRKAFSNSPGRYEYYESLRKNDKLLKKIIEICIKRKMNISIDNRHNISIFKELNFDDQKDIKNLLDIIRGGDEIFILGGRTNFGSFALELHLHFHNNWTREIRNSLAEQLERVIKSIKDDEDKSKKGDEDKLKKGDDFRFDGSKKKIRSKKSIKKKKSRRKRKNMLGRSR